MQKVKVAATKHRLNGKSPRKHTETEVKGDDQHPKKGGTYSVPRKTL